MNSIIHTPAGTSPEEAYNYITKREFRENVLREGYGVNSKLPGKKTLEKALGLIEDTLKFSDSISFYKRVNELCDDFIETGLNLGDLDSFLGGVQKEKFLHAVKVQNIYEKSKNYISDRTIMDDAGQVKKYWTWKSHIPLFRGWKNTIKGSWTRL